MHAMVVVETCRGRKLAAACPREEREREVLEGEEGRGRAGLGPHEEREREVSEGEEGRGGVGLMRRRRGRSRREREGGAALGLGVSKGRGGERCCSVSDRDRRVNPNSLIFVLEDVYCTRLGLLGLGLFEDGHL